jgi:tetratricopeptide (TPR) repeat protein
MQLYLKLIYKNKLLIDPNHISTPTLDAKTLSKCKCELRNGNKLTSIQGGDLLYKTGLCLIKQGDFHGALTNLLKAKESFLEEPPSWHRFSRKLPILFDNIAFLYLFLNDRLKALTLWKKTIDIRNSFYSHSGT